MRGARLAVHFSSARSDWATPWALFRLLATRFPMEVDVCAEPHNAKLDRYFTKKQDGLAQDWSHLQCWMNPPYGRGIYRWVAKACEAKSCVALLPARTDTAWFHNHVLGKAKIEFIRGRVRFEGAQHHAPFPSMIAIWNSNRARTE